MNPLARILSSVTLMIAANYCGPILGGSGGFVEIGSAVGIGSYQMAPGMGGGFAAADYDEDGDVDLFVPCAEGVPDRLYRNLTVEGGSLLFEEIAADVGLASLQRGRSALWLDVDGDGRLDLWVAGDCFQTDCPPGVSLMRLYRQTSSGNFEDVTQSSGLFDDAGQHRFWRHRGGLSAGDIDNDGDPDLFSTIWQGGVQLYRNRGDGRFTNISATLGAISQPNSGIGPWQALFHDFNRDGMQDIFVAVDFSENYLLVQQPDGGFVDQAASAAVDRAWNGMGAVLGDIDNDGDFDLYVTNISDDFNGTMRHSNLYFNRRETGPLVFEEISESAGVDDVAWGWGAVFLDADNDGDLDLAATNGFTTSVDSSRFFFNQGGASPLFDDASSAVGFNDMEWGSGLGAIDLDRDGDLDLVQTCAEGPLRILDNRLSQQGNHYLVVRPRRVTGFRRPLGALVRVEAGGKTMMRIINAGYSFMSQEPAEAFFGLGPASLADRVTVEWPRGGRTILHQVQADQRLTITDEFLCFLEKDRRMRFATWPHGMDLIALVGMLAQDCP